MIGYIDSSVLLRIILNQEGKLDAFSKLERPVASKLLKTECLRALDKARLNGVLEQSEHLKAIEDLYDGLESVEFIEISDYVLDRAGTSFSIPLGTLDAIHLCSAVIWREQTAIAPIFLTHDLALARAAKTLGFTVLGAAC